MQPSYHRRLSFVGYLAAALVLSMVPGLSAFLGWFETYFHELSHGLTAIATGGSATRLELRIDGSGTMWHAGGFLPAVAYAGYAGAAIWGSLLYIAASHSERRPTLISGIIAASILWCALFLVSKADIVSLFICGCIGGLPALLVTGRGTFVCRSALRLIGAYVMLSAARSPTYILAVGASHNDASDLTRSLLLPEWIWVFSWVAVALGCIVAAWMVEAASDRHDGDGSMVTNTPRVLRR